MKCKFCDQEKKLVESHIIPQGFYRVVKDSPNEPMIFLASEGKAVPSRTFTGVYDTDILCADCESIFSAWDAHALKAFYAEPDKPYVKRDRNGHIAAVQLQQATYKEMKLFLLSLLWRCSVSSQKFFAKAKLAPDAFGRLTEMLLNRDAGSADDFATVIAKFENLDLPVWMFEPRLEADSDGSTYAFIYLPMFRIQIKADLSPTSAKVAPFILRPEEPVFFHLLDFQASAERRAAVKMGMNVAKD